MEPRRPPPPLRHHKPPRPKAPHIDPMEPSSPKVSCIGQVRAKTSGRRRRRREEVGGAAAFRSRSLRRDQSWVHLPFCCACELLKLLASAFGAFWRCGGGRWRSTCCCCSCSCEVCGEERREVEKDEGVLTAAVAEKGKGCGLRELEMVADKLENGRLILGRRGEGDDESFGDDDEDDDEMGSCGGTNNALLLMRCRSDPMKMSALAAGFMDSAADADDAAETGDLRGVDAVGGCEDGTVIGGNDPDLNCGEEYVGLKLDTMDMAKEERLLAPESRWTVNEEAEGAKPALGKVTVARRHSSVSTEKEHGNSRASHDVEGSRRHSFSSEKDTFPSRLSSSNREGRRSSFSTERDAVRPPQLLKLLPAEKLSVTEQVTREGERRNELPADCLLLMMYEPKLSMEVSRETWVCTTDFVRWRPRHWQRVNRKGGDGNLAEDRVEEEEEAELMGGSVRQCERNERPPLNAESAMSLRGPFVLMRSKSEPARPSPGIGVQKGYFWKSRYEPMGATGDAGILAANR